MVHVKIIIDCTTPNYQGTLLPFLWIRLGTQKLSSHSRRLFCTSFMIQGCSVLFKKALYHYFKAKLWRSTLKSSNVRLLIVTVHDCRSNGRWGMCFSSGTLKRSVHKVNTGTESWDREASSRAWHSCNYQQREWVWLSRILGLWNLFHEMF